MSQEEIGTEGIAPAQPATTRRKSHYQRRTPAPKQRAADAEPQRTKPRETRANGGTLSEEFIDPETGKPYARQSRMNDGIGAGVFDIPKSLRKPGWDYQWAPVKVLNEPVDAAQHVEMRAQGWRPVHPNEMPGQVPPGWTKEVVERGNQILYKRPMHLTEQARAELAHKAYEQMHDRFASAEMAPPGTAPRNTERNPTTVRTTIEELPPDLRSQYQQTVEEV